MKLAIFLFGISLAAQPTLTLGPAAATSPGQTVQVSLNLTGSAGAAMAALQFTVTVPPGLTVGIPQPTPGSADVIICGPLTPTPPSGTIWPTIVTSMPCYMFGQTVATDGSGAISLNEGPLADGVIGTIPITVLSGAPGSNAAITLSQTAGVAPSGSAVSVVALGSLPFTLPIGQAACDINGDGKIDSADLQIAENQLIGKQPQTVAWTLNIINVFEILNTVVRLSAGLPSACVMQ